MAAAAAMGAEPRPASLEKTPLATPQRIADNIVAIILPPTPPATAFTENAMPNIWASPSGICFAFIIITPIPHAKYRTAIKGTTFSQTLPMLLIPPTKTTSASVVITTPVTMFGILKVLFKASAIELACVMLPIPKDARTAKTAKSVAITAPSFLYLKPFFMAYIGPPTISPSAFISLYFTARTLSAYLVESPKRAEIHIQTIAPGPPMTMAVATPTILPVPMVAARAVIRDWNGVISPSLLPMPSLSGSLKIDFSANPRLRHGRKFSRMVRKTPVPTSSTSIKGPHTKSFTAFSITAKSIRYLPHMRQRRKGQTTDRLPLCSIALSHQRFILSSYHNMGEGVCKSEITGQPAAQPIPSVIPRNKYTSPSLSFPSPVPRPPHSNQAGPCTSRSDHFRLCAAETEVI